jgi:hypothetical protein
LHNTSKGFFKSSATTLTNFEVDATGSAFSYSTGNYKESQTLQAIQILLQYKKY